METDTEAHVIADDELLHTFREETSERLDRIVETLLTIELQGSDPDLVATLFRDTHSIKGNSGMLGFGEAQEIAHAMEDVIETAGATGSLVPGLINPMLAAADAIRDLVAGATGLAAGALAALRAEPESEIGPAPVTAPAVVAEAAPAVTAKNGDQAGSPRSIRVETEKVDRLLDVVGETVLHRRRLEHLVRAGALTAEGVEEELDHGELLLDDLQHSVTRMRTLPLRSITGTYPRAVRDMAASAGKQVRLTLTGTDTQLDRLTLDGISETIVHLIRNSISHGVETPADRVAANKPEVGQLELRAEARGEWVAISVHDDGKGVSPALLARAHERGSLAEVLAQAGMSTTTEVNELSGRGVGLDAVKRHVESLGGSVDVESEYGLGTSVTMRLPLMLSMVRLLVIESRGQVFGVPLVNAVEVLQIGRTLSLAGRQSVDVRGESVPLVNVSEALGAGASEGGSLAVIVSTSGRRVALTCDAIVDEYEVVVRSLGPLLSGLPGYLGAAILADARIVLIIDPAFIVGGQATASQEIVNGQPESRRHKILVVDDQLTVRELERSILETAGYSVVTAADGRAALDVLARDTEVALVLTDIEMPNVTGFELLAAIRSAPERPSLPVVVVTSRGDDEARRQGAEAGADAYVVKADFAQAGLLKIVRRLIER